MPLLVFSCSMLLPYSPSLPGGWVDHVFACCRGQRVRTCAERNGWIICCHFSMRQINWISPMGRRQFPFCCHVLWTQLVLSLPSFSPFRLPSLCSLYIHLIPLHRRQQCLLMHYHKSTNNVTFALPIPLNNLSKKSWMTFASECCQSRFSSCLLKRPWEEALRSNDSDDLTDQMWTCTLKPSLYRYLFSHLCFSLYLWMFGYQGRGYFIQASFVLQ